MSLRNELGSIPSFSTHSFLELKYLQFGQKILITILAPTPARSFLGSKIIAENLA
jgi:hypothetical protein